jgi:hypothetical protein
VTPLTVLDTRNGTGGVAVAKLAAGATATFLVAGVGTIPAAGVSDVFAEISALNVTGSGALDAYDTDDNDPGIWTLPITSGQNSTVSDLTQVGADGYVSVTNEAATGAADVVVRALGYVQTGYSTTAGNTYVPLPDHGVLDTLTGLGDPNGIAQIPAGGSVTFGVTGQGVPSDAAGVAVYLGTAGDATAPGYLSVAPAGAADPNARVVDYQAGQQVHNLYFGAMSASGQLKVTNHGPQPVDVRAAVQGYLVSPTTGEAGDAYTSVAPARIVDTRNGTGVSAVPVPANGSITFSVAGVAGVPSSGVSAVAESVAALDPAATGYLTSYPAGGTDPLNAVVNYIGSDVQDNDLTTPLVSSVSPTGRETITNHSTGTVDVVVAIKGYYTAPAAPDQPGPVNATLTSAGTATVTWQPPATDGGAAITGYQVKLYNADGTVNQTDAFDPGTTTATITGLDGTAAYTADVTAINAIGSGTVANIAVSQLPTGTITDAGDASGSDMTVGFSGDSSTTALTPNSVTGDNFTYNSSGAVTSETTDPTVSAATTWNTGNSLGSYQCLLNSDGGITAYAPARLYASSTVGTSNWIFYAYTKTNARWIVTSSGRKEAFQLMLCSVGGGQPGNNNGRNLLFAGDTMTVARSADAMLGWKWGTGEKSGKVITTLNFTITGDNASVSADLPITVGGGSYRGDFGADGRYPGYPASLSGYQPNRVNAYFTAGPGVTSFEGNTAQVLYEWPMSQGTSFSAYAYAYMHAPPCLMGLLC